MSARGTPVGFGIYDLFTRVAPGSIFLLIIFSPVVVDLPPFPLDTSVVGNASFLLVIFAILSLVVGEGINHVASIVYLPPRSFTRFLREQGVDVPLGIVDRTKQALPMLSVSHSSIYTATGADFWELFTSQFQIEEDFNSSWDIYRILLSYMEPRLSPKAQRQHVIYHFVNNTLCAIIVGIPMAVGAEILSYYMGSFSNVSAVVVFLLTVLAICLVGFLLMMFTGNSSRFVSDLLIEYYIDRVEAGAIEDTSQTSRQSTLNDSRFSDE